MFIYLGKYRVTQKKTELTKSLITPEMLFSWKQNFSWIMYNLCSQHLQNFNSVQQKHFVLQPLKDMFQIRPPALKADLDSPGQIPNDPPALLLTLMAALRSGMVLRLCSYILALR